MKETNTLEIKIPTPTEPVKEDILKEIIYRNWKNGDEIGLYTEIKDILLQIEKEISDKIRDTGNNTRCNFCGEYMASGDCDCTGVNKGLQVALEVIKKYKQ